MLGPVDTAGAAHGGTVGRYRVFDEIARGGMASVHVARLVGPVGFARTVAVKRLHPVYAKDPDFVAMLVDEARLAARVRHRNVISSIDFVEAGEELLLVMEYVPGESLAALLRDARAAEGGRPPAPVAVRIAADVLHGLHAAHEATDDAGLAMQIVHRDVSPQNVLVGSDGVARVLDFGIAKAVARMQTTREGNVKGKLAYMAPEQIRALPLDRRADVFAAAVVLWEALTGRRLFAADDPGVVALNVLGAPILPPSRFAPDVGEALDAVVLRGLARDAGARFGSAAEMAAALEQVGLPADADAVAAWLRSRASERLEARAMRVAEIERSSAATPPARGGVAGSARPVGEGDDARTGAGDPAVRARAEAETAVTPDVARDAFDSSYDRPLEPPRRRRLAAVVVLAVAAVAVATVAFGFSLRSAPAETAATGEGAQPTRLDAPTAAPTAATTATPTAGTTTATAEPAAEGAAASEASPTHAAAPLPPASAAPASATGAAKGGASPRPAASADCNPPFTWDAERRIKVPKRHCFR